MYTFSTALVNMAIGKPMRRKSWNERFGLVVINGEMFHLGPDKIMTKLVMMSLNDILAVDWVFTKVED